MASSSPRKTLSDPAAVFPQKSSDRLLADIYGDVDVNGEGVDFYAVKA